MKISIGGVIYIVIGVIIADNRGYFTHINSLSHFLSAIFAVFLWPLLLFGANLHLSHISL